MKKSSLRAHTVKRTVLVHVSLHADRLRGSTYFIGVIEMEQPASALVYFLVALA